MGYVGYIKGQIVFIEFIIICEARYMASIHEHSFFCLDIGENYMFVFNSVQQKLQAQSADCIMVLSKLWTYSGS